MGKVPREAFSSKGVCFTTQCLSAFSHSSFNFKLILNKLKQNADYSHSQPSEHSLNYKAINVYVYMQRNTLG